jgi:hypothetical protein
MRTDDGDRGIIVARRCAVPRDSFVRHALGRIEPQLGAERIDGGIVRGRDVDLQLCAGMRADRSGTRLSVEDSPQVSNESARPVVHLSPLPIAFHRPRRTSHCHSATWDIPSRLAACVKLPNILSAMRHPLRTPAPLE